MEETPLEGFARYAVYFAPPRGSPLGRLGSGWLGHDPEGEAPPPPEVDDLPAPREALVARPRRYGFHATLKAPFRLAAGVEAAALDAGLGALAASQAACLAPPLQATVADGFVSLRPGGPAPGLDALAAACVTGLDRFRAPLPPQERAARAAGLDAAETAHLERWGYPYVLDRFAFHMTLTGPLPEREAAQAAAALGRAFAPALAGPLEVGQVALFGDPGEGRPFRLLRRHALSG